MALFWSYSEGLRLAHLEEAKIREYKIYKKNISTFKLQVIV